MRRTLSGLAHHKAGEGRNGGTEKPNNGINSTWKKNQQTERRLGLVAYFMRMVSETLGRATILFRGNIKEFHSVGILMPQMINSHQRTERDTSSYAQPVTRATQQYGSPRPTRLARGPVVLIDERGLRTSSTFYRVFITN